MRQPCSLGALSAVLLAAAAACSGPPSQIAGQSDASLDPADASLPLPADAAPDPDAPPTSADFAIDMGRSQIDLSIAQESFDADSCELHATEQCVAAPGERTILRFSVETSNLGDADLVLGSPLDNPGFEYSECHQHYHFAGYAQYRLLSESGDEVLVGRKQAFCLVDFEPYAAGASLNPIYSCLNQGLQKGWSDVYSADLDCQFLDITGVPPGNYQLEVVANPDGLLEDSSSLNNSGTIPVVIGDADLETPTEACAPLSSRYLDRMERECDWDFAGEFDCTPGTQAGAGCASNCGVGSCTGDPMIRVCDADEANCTSGVALGSNNDRCGSTCPLASEFLCPPSGKLAVYTASFDHGASYTCNVVMNPGPL